MLDQWAPWLFGSTGLTPHGFCLLWEPGLIWAYAVSDAGIGLAYLTIPCALLVFARRRRDLVFRPVFLLFAAFILLCGATHGLDVLTLWVPAYGLEAAVKALTAVVSIVTAITLWWLLPEALALPSPAQHEAAHAALRASEARHRANFEYSPVPLYTMDAGGFITGASDSFVALLGFTRLEVIGRNIADFWATLVEPATLEADRAALYADGEIRDVERRLRRRDGSIVEALVTARVEREGTTTWVLSAVTDVTARKRAESALRITEERLHQAQKMEAVGQLTGGIAHDFNNMLQGIAGGLDMMERRIAQGRAEDATRYLTMARQAVESAAGLTHRMLAFARRQSLTPTPVEPDKLVRGMEELISRTVGPEIRVELRLHDGVWSALCDANQLESALLNLAINARDAMPDGGTLIIATADREITASDLIDQEDIEPGCYVEIGVTDTGAGMPPDVLARAFEPFFTTKPLGQGTGLGLSQIYGFVQQSGGFVRLTSSLGQGTTVRLYLPRHQLVESSAPAPQPGDHPGPMTASGTILLVEDDWSVRGLVADALRDLGCEVIEATDGPSGLRIVQSRARFDLLLTDVGLPGLNGRQLADAARVVRPDIPVLLITGYAGKALDEAVLPAGMEVIPKPFTLDELIARVRPLLRKDIDEAMAS